MTYQRRRAAQLNELANEKALESGTTDLKTGLMPDNALAGAYE
jgi:hypothetical protein